jgi:hypothetical protein
LSFALVHDLAVREDADLFFTFAASGFRDFTRIAASHPEMWRDICLANREALLGELDSYRAQLDELRTGAWRRTTASAWRKSSGLPARRGAVGWRLMSRLAAALCSAWCWPFRSLPTAEAASHPAGRGLSQSGRCHPIPGQREARRRARHLGWRNPALPQRQADQRTAWFVDGLPKRRSMANCGSGAARFERLSGIVRKEVPGRCRMAAGALHDLRTTRCARHLSRTCRGDAPNHTQANVPWLREIEQFSVVDRNSLQNA